MSTTSTEQLNGSGGETLSLETAARLIDGLSAFDFDAAVGAMSRDVHFRALLPGRLVELQGAAAVRDAFRTWFGGAEHWEMLEAVVGEVGGRVHVRWRLKLTNPDRGPGNFLVEQQLYADAAPDGRLCDVSLLCTGYRALDG